MSTFKLPTTRSTRGSTWRARGVCSVILDTIIQYMENNQTSEYDLYVLQTFQNVLSALLSEAKTCRRGEPSGTTITITHGQKNNILDALKKLKSDCKMSCSNVASGFRTLGKSLEPVTKQISEVDKPTLFMSMGMPSYTRRVTTVQGRKPSKK